MLDGICWSFGMDERTFLLFSSPEIHTHLLTWWGNWLDWRCRRGCHGCVPSGCSPCCPSSRPSCQGKTNISGADGTKETALPGVTERFMTSDHDQGRNNLSFHYGHHMSHLMPFRLVRCPTCSWRSRTSFPWHSLHSPLLKWHDWCPLCYSWGRSKYLGMWQEVRMSDPQTTDDVKKLSGSTQEMCVLPERICVCGSLTSLVELEWALHGVNGHRHWTHFVQCYSQCVLITHWDLFVAFALGRHACCIVAARLIL